MDVILAMHVSPFELDKRFMYIVHTGLMCGYFEGHFMYAKLRGTQSYFIAGQPVKYLSHTVWLVQEDVALGGAQTRHHYPHLWLHHHYIIHLT